MSTLPILIVDDDRDILELFQTVLENEGYNVKTASSGGEALELVRQEKFSLVLLDIILPDIRGTEVARELKAIDNSLAIIFITGYSEFSDTVDFIGYGASDLILKPISNEKLIQITNEILQPPKSRW
jgi:DNA-binding response OmpR family regulator